MLQESTVRCRQPGNSLEASTILGSDSKRRALRPSSDGLRCIATGDAAAKAEYSLSNEMKSHCSPKPNELGDRRGVRQDRARAKEQRQ